MEGCAILSRQRFLYELEDKDDIKLAWVVDFTEVVNVGGGHDNKELDADELPKSMPKES